MLIFEVKRRAGGRGQRRDDTHTAMIHTSPLRWLRLSVRCFSSNMNTHQLAQLAILLQYVKYAIDITAASAGILEFTFVAYSKAR